MTADPAPPRRRFQFRLRKLLIGVTVVAAIAAWQRRTHSAWAGMRYRNT